MNGLKQQLRSKQAEAAERKHLYETRKSNREMRAELEKLKESNKMIISKTKKDYDVSALDQKNHLEVKLSKIRAKNEMLLKEEQMRFDKTLEETKLNNEEKISEIQNSNQKEIQNIQETHNDYMTNAKQKFEAEKMKLEQS